MKRITILILAATFIVAACKKADGLDGSNYSRLVGVWQNADTTSMVEFKKNGHVSFQCVASRGTSFRIGKYEERSNLDGTISFDLKGYGKNLTGNRFLHVRLDTTTNLLYGPGVIYNDTFPNEVPPMVKL